MKKILYKPFLAIAFLLLGALAVFLHFGLKDYTYNGLTEVSINWIVDYQESPLGYEAYLYGSYVIFCVDDNGNLVYRIDAVDDIKNVVYTNICFDDKNHLYVHKLVLDDEAYATKSESIEEYDTNGEFVKYIALFDYSDYEHKPHRESRIAGMNYLDGHIRYLYLNYDGSYAMYDCDLETLTTNSVDKPPIGEYVSICSAAGFDNGDYAVILTNGTVGRLDTDGIFTAYAACDFQLDELVTAYIPVEVSTYQNDIYVISGIASKEVYKVSKDEVVKICSIEDILGYYDWESVIDSVIVYDGKLAVSSMEVLAILDDNGNVVETESLDVNLGLGVALYSITNYCAKYIAFLAILIGIILFVGYLAQWRVTLLLKQLCMTIPLVIILVTALLFTMKNAVRKSYEDTFTQEMVAINELIARNIDGDEIAQIKDMTVVEQGLVQKYCDYLNESVDYNTGYWNKKFDIGIYMVDDEKVYYALVAGNRDLLMPFREVDYSFEDDESTVSDGYDGKQISDSDSEVQYIEDGIQVTNMIVDTPIVDSDGNIVAVLELSSDISTVNENINQMTKKVGMFAAIFLPIFCLVLAIISYINTRYLNKLSDVVNDISEGDFKARIDKVPKDEVGKICNSVNLMAEQLDDYFRILDRNEKFYYKFVPEKFRELLHKEEFTDLALGDAESVDLTVLFCDIRAFSINSEMMTAKENFEFVNIVYGKAGPIIRRHNGFIDKYIGDAIMALFENADDAVAAGREMYQEIVLNPETAKELKVSSINIGIGIHSGMARIGIVGEDERMSGTVISNTVNLASRLESLTKKYAAAMLISKDTFDRLSDPDSLNARYLGMIQVAGVNEVKAVYEVLDCLSEKDERFKTSQKNDLKEAIRLFHLGNQEDALAVMKELKAQKEQEKANDPAIDMYVEYIESGIESGNTDTKIFRFDRK